MKEVWKDIPEYEGLYEVSNTGIVKSKDRYVNHLRNGRLFLKGVELKYHYNHKGYKKVGLCKNGKSKNIAIHILVAITFLDKDYRDKKLVCDHINNVKTDNRLCNLQLISNRDNITKQPIGAIPYVGVSKSGNKFRASIKHNNIR